LISIPSGAIKSSSSDYFSNAQLVFQFLLVRLRETVEVENFDDDRISIPSGAIKSLHILTERKQNFSISIPSGAIKRKFVYQTQKVWRHFNSFWCD